MDPRPVLYLDLDDTVVSWADGSPRAAVSTRGFLLWALERFEVRWLTRWARDGRMNMRLLLDLSRLTGVEAGRLRCVRGLDWSSGGSKLDGIAWLEHLVLGRPFVWLEDEDAATYLPFLQAAGLGSSYLHCNISRDPESLAAVKRVLQLRFPQAV